MTQCSAATACAKMPASIRLCVLFVVLLWLLVAQGDGRRIVNAKNAAFVKRCYDPRTGIAMRPLGIRRPIKKLCMQAVCFRNYTMVVDRSTCIVPGVKFNTTYPDCCPQVLCRRGNRVRNLYTNETVYILEPKRKPKNAKQQQKKGNKMKNKKNKKFENGKKQNSTASVEDAVNTPNSTAI